MEIRWSEGACIRAEMYGETVTLSANREGLLSLADQLTALAEELPGSHIHYDEYNSLEEGSCELIIEKKDFGPEDDI